MLYVSVMDIRYGGDIKSVMTTFIEYHIVRERNHYWKKKNRCMTVLVRVGFMLCHFS